MAFMRIYSDASGESHFAELEIEYESEDFVPPAPPVQLSAPTGASTYRFELVHPGWFGDWHPAPQRLLAVYLAGTGEITASDGETRPLVAGTVLLAEDTTGKGHVTRVTGTDDMHVLILLLQNEDDGTNE